MLTQIMAELCQTQQLAGDSDYSKCCWYFFCFWDTGSQKKGTMVQDVLRTGLSLIESFLEL